MSATINQQILDGYQEQELNEMVNKNKLSISTREKLCNLAILQKRRLPSSIMFNDFDRTVRKRQNTSIYGSIYSSQQPIFSFRKQFIQNEIFLDPKNK